ncbi:MAG TPA: DUF4180 domain-containing protein [Pilimelia sp.]|nr:DUF4180 domain-containing protein [Pilimelia sp.]
MGDTAVLVCAEEGGPLRGEADAVELLGHAYGHGADVVAVPVRRLGEDFFRLRSGVAGAILQKFANYRLRLVVVGDVSGYVAASTALRDFVLEANRGGQVWFVADLAELPERLGRGAGPA